MLIEKRGNLRVLIPSSDLWLYNDKLKIFRKEVFLGIEDDGSDCTEVTDTEKTELEKNFETEIDVENDEAINEIEQKAQAYDIIVGGIE